VISWPHPLISALPEIRYLIGKSAKADLQDGASRLLRMRMIASMQEAEKILGRFPGPVRLYPSRLWVSALLLMSVAGVIVLSFYVSGTSGSVRPHGAYDTILSWVSLIGLAALAVALLIHLLLPNTVCLILDAEGFEIHRFAGSERVRWREVRGFDTRRRWAGRGTIEQLVFETADGGGTLPNNYGLGLQVLLHLMKAWRERAVEDKSSDRKR
jgi:hypothetical protein